MWPAPRVAILNMAASSHFKGSTTINRERPIFHMARALAPMFSGERGRCRTTAMRSRGASSSPRRSSMPHHPP